MRMVCDTPPLRLNNLFVCSGLFSFRCSLQPIMRVDWDLIGGPEGAFLPLTVVWVCGESFRLPLPNPNLFFVSLTPVWEVPAPTRA